MKNLKNKGLVIFILGLLSTIGPFSIDMYLPSFEVIAEDLNTSMAHVGLSLSSFFIGISLGQLLYGPIIDRFGRKNPLYIGLIIYLLTSLACAFSRDVDALIYLRLFQAIGSCAGMVVARALVRDLFPVNENAKIFSLLMLVIAVSPVAAPTIGGFVSAHFGWRMIFFILAGIALITLFTTIFWLPDGMPADKNRSLRPIPIFKDFVGVAKVPKFYTFAFVGAIASSGLYAYIAGSPYVFMKIYEVSEKQYGWIFAFIALGMTIAAQLNTFLLRRFTSEQITLVASIFQVSTGLLIVLLSSFGAVNIYVLIGLIWTYLATQGLVYPNTSALALEPFDKNAGTASALMGAVQLGVGAIVTAVVSGFDSQSVFPMVVTMCVCGTTAFTVLLFGMRSMKRRNAFQKVYKV